MGKKTPTILGIVFGGLIMTGYDISLYFKDGRFYQSVNDRVLELNPWVGEQLKEWIKNGKSWSRKELSKHEPNDLANYLKKTAPPEERALFEQKNFKT